MRNISGYIREIQMYFFCQQGGYDPDNPCTQDYQMYSYPFLTAAAFALLGLFPVVNLVYAINLKELKAALHKLQTKLKKKPTHSSDAPKTRSTAVTMTPLKNKASRL